MLHPDSLNMFENGSFLRRRRRFKQESSNAVHRTHPGGRQRGQRNSPSLVNSNTPADVRPNGTKASRSRNQMEKDADTDEIDALESPRKVTSKNVTMIRRERLFSSRNMPVDTQLRRWNQSKPVNREITFPAICIRRQRKHRQR